MIYIANICNFGKKQGLDDTQIYLLIEGLYELGAYLTFNKSVRTGKCFNRSKNTDIGGKYGGIDAILLSLENNISKMSLSIENGTRDFPVQFRLGFLNCSIAISEMRTAMLASHLIEQRVHLGPVAILKKIKPACSNRDKLKFLVSVLADELKSMNFKINAARLTSLLRKRIYDIQFQ